MSICTKYNSFHFTSLLYSFDSDENGDISKTGLYWNTIYNYKIVYKYK